MTHAQLPLSALPAWQTLNNVVVRSDVRVADVPGKGFGLVVAGGGGPMPTVPTDAPLLSVPQDLVLHAAAVEDYAKQDRNFRLLLDAVGPQSPRGDVVLFLLVQLVLARGRAGEPAPAVCLSTPWTEYVRFLLAAAAPLPTLWTDAERRLLRGTSLEAALEAKRWTLEHEFDDFRTRSSDLPAWQAALWAGRTTDDDYDNDDDDGEDDGDGRPRLRDWVLVDAWYRSRCLELPRAGPAMVPCVDMANHSATPSAYYEEAGEGSVLLLARPQDGAAAAAATTTTTPEITINYAGDCSKPAAEMLFSYGFIDPQAVSRRLVLPFPPLPDDPLAQAKLHVFGSPPRLAIALQDGGEEEEEEEKAVHWRCPFAHLACVNEEDGLDFRLRQETDGSTQLRVFWQDADVTDQARYGGDGDRDGDGDDSATDFSALTRNHPLAPVLRLRVVTVVQQVVEEHLERMQAAGGSAPASDGGSDGDEDGATANGDDDDDDDTTVRSDVARQAGLLRDMEARILSRALEELEAERADLLTNATVVQYLASMDGAEGDHMREATGDRVDDDDDFS